MRGSRKYARASKESEFFLYRTQQFSWKFSQRANHPPQKARCPRNADLTVPLFSGATGALLWAKRNPSSKETQGAPCSLLSQPTAQPLRLFCFFIFCGACEGHEQGLQMQRVFFLLDAISFRLTSIPKMPERFSLFRSSLALNLVSSSASSSTACLATS